MELIRRLNSRLTIAVMVVAAALTLTVTAVLRPWSALGQDPRSDVLNDLPLPSADGDRVAAEVNGVPITLLTLQGSLVFAQSREPEATADGVLDDLIDYELWFQEGQRRGLVPSEAEVSEAVEIARAGISAEDLELALDYAAKMGETLTPDEYWKSDGVRDGITQSITVGRVQSAVAGDDPLKAEANLARMLSELRARAVIERDETVIAVAR